MEYISKQDQMYMSRALSLARRGYGSVSPNPMVGAVIVDSSGNVIGEGWHRQYGQGHAEVNAVASVRPELLSRLTDSTMYVTLEPCSHYGKTPPCAAMLIERGIPRVCVGALDPFEAVSGRGIAMLKDAGVDVTTGVLERECEALNVCFMTAHREKRPWVTLKWAQTADGYIDVSRVGGIDSPLRISDDETMMLMHRLRSGHDAVMVGARTVTVDRPKLDVRLWPGHTPRPVVAHRTATQLAGLDNIAETPMITGSYNSISDLLTVLYNQGITSLLVEGGAQLLESFIQAGIFDLIRVETNCGLIVGGGGVIAPKVPGVASVTYKQRFGCNIVDFYAYNPLIDYNHPFFLPHTDPFDCSIYMPRQI